MGILLLVAAVMKGWQSLTEPVANNYIWSYRPFLILTVEFELALGIWLLSGVFKRLGSVCPQTILPHPRLWAYRGGTRTEQELQRFFDTNLPGGPDSLWQPYALQVQVKDIVGPMEEVIVLQTEMLRRQASVGTRDSPDGRVSSRFCG